MFYGSVDASNFITVDKPPAALWVMDLSARVFGFNTWSVMVPNVVEGVLAVALLFAAVRRVAGDAAGLLAGVLLATTPVAALMFRFDNPDSLLVLLLVAAAYCLTRAIERAGTAWLVATGTLVGFAFLAKMLQALTVVPFFGLAYLVAAPTALRRRCGQLLGSLAALVVAGGWWVAIVALVPAADRPFIDGSPDNSIINLIFVYNGFGRLTGTGSGGGGGSNFGGTPGVLRLFNDVMGGQASWLLPAATVSVAGVLVARRHRNRLDATRAAVLLWGGWLLVTAGVFSFGRGVIHTYYTVALAPAIAALVAVGAQKMWTAMASRWARGVGALTVAVTSTWAVILLDRTPSWNPWLRWLTAAAGLLALVAVLAYPVVRRAGRFMVPVMVAAVATAVLTGPVAFAAATISGAQTGSVPSAGPASAQAGFGGFPGAGPGFGGNYGFGSPDFSGGPPGATGGSGTFGQPASVPAGSTQSPLAGTTSNSGTAGVPIGGANRKREGLQLSAGSSSGGSLSGGSFSGGSSSGGSFSGGSFAGGSFAGGSFGGDAINTALDRALEHDASRYRWVAAVDGSMSAASLELSTHGAAVMAIGGFSGQGGNLSLSAFQSDVAKGQIHYYLGSSGGGFGSTAGSSAITSWVTEHFRTVTIGGQTVYDLTERTG